MSNFLSYSNFTSLVRVRYLTYVILRVHNYVCRYWPKLMILVNIHFIFMQYFNSGPNFNSNTISPARVGGSSQLYDHCPFDRPFSNVSHGGLL